MTASVSVSIMRPNGTSISGSAQVPDEMIADIAATLGALIFDAAATPPAAVAPASAEPAPEAP
ncbi:hypothetical protein ACFVGV_06140 [Pseudarthrobacter scleromae]|uniref:hypothetical protein n=1 Tax=Pseudarthrobacter scleromae TaxID=158897 RepID=UPI00363DDD5D